MDELKRKLCEVIVTRCKLTDVDVDHCDYDAPLFLTDDESEIEGGFELDSIDALEIVAGVKSEFGVTIDVKDMTIFRNINSLAEYINEQLSDN